jgi:hypothetical protein
MTQQWKLIDSAPKTGRTLLLGYWNSLGKWRTVRGQWMSAECIASSWEEPDDIEAGWFETAVEAEDVPNCWPIDPTHWLPLPDAPCATCNDQGAVGNILTAEPCPDCTPPASAQDDAKDEDSIALDKLANYIADSWPDKKYGLEEICQRLHAMWPGEFIPLEDLKKNEPNAREALRALLIHWKRFEASDGNQQDAYNLLVKTARFAWQFAEAEANRVPVSAPAAGDARDAARLDWLQQHDGRFFNKDRISSIVGVGFLVAGDPQGVRHPTVRAAIDAARAASQQQGDAA